MNNVHTFFQKISDPRVTNRCLHRLDEVLFIAFCTLICNGEDFEDMAAFGKERKEWLKQHIDLPNGIPSHDTFNRVLQIIDPFELSDFLAEDASALLDHISEGLVSFDGKKLRGESPKSQGTKGLFLLNAWVNKGGFCIGQERVDDKSNEITAIPKLLDRLPLKGATVRVDAIGAQREIAEKVIEKEADYCLALKANQPTLLEFADQEESWEAASSSLITEEKGHGREEKRACRALPATALYPPAILESWKGLKTVIRLDSERKIGDKIEYNTRYYISSQTLSLKEHSLQIREHWGIENRLHWHLDVTFGEDACRARSGNAAENLSVLRKIALQRIRQMKTKLSLKKRRFSASLSTDYLEEVLGL